MTLVKVSPQNAINDKTLPLRMVTEQKRHYIQKLTYDKILNPKQHKQLL
jgi:hypothetical protein